MVPLNFDDYCRAVKQANVEFTLTQRAVAPWWNGYVDLPPLAIQFGSDGGASIANGTISDSNYVLIGRHHASDTEIVINGEWLYPDDFVLLPPGGQFIFSCNGPRTWVAITAPKVVVESLWSHQERLRLRVAERRACIVPIDAATTRNIIETAEVLWRLRNERIDDGCVIEQARDLARLVERVLSQDGLTSRASLETLKYYDIIAPALADLHQLDSFDEWYVEDLARRSSVHPRTLLRAFQRVLRMGPVSYLRYRQLNLIRRKLIEPSLYRTITEVMQSVGVTDMGRVSGAYRALFGELPSQTVRSARQAAE